MKILSTLLCLCLMLSVFSLPSAQSMAPDKSEILFSLYESDIATARQALDEGLITCVELTQYFLDRIEAYNDTFNCFITLCDNALEEAAERDARLQENTDPSMLLGIPIVVKDNIAYAGYPTTDGLWRYGSVSWENATVVQTLLDAGAVVLGKTNMSTEAQDAQYTASDAIGETFNAYGTHLSAGGSSGGSAAAVSLNFCYAGLGTDTNASLRYPAVLNGCITLRPSRGLLDRKGITILNGTRDVPGVITRSVEDQAIVLGEMAGLDYSNALESTSLEGLRIGILQELCYCDTAYNYRSKTKMDPEIEEAFSQAVRNLRKLGATVITVSIPNIYTLAENCEYNSSYAIERYLSVYSDLFSERKLDAVIFPTYLHTPDSSLTVTGWENVNYDAFYSNCSLVSSPLGVPEIAIPIGYHSIGSGIGLEVAALRGQEESLLHMAYAYTETYDTRLVPDTAPNLYEESIEMCEPSEESFSTPSERITEPNSLTGPATEENAYEEVDTSAPSLAADGSDDIPNSSGAKYTLPIILICGLGISSGIYITAKKLKPKKVHKS